MQGLVMKQFSFHLTKPLFPLRSPSETESPPTFSMHHRLSFPNLKARLHPNRSVTFRIQSIREEFDRRSDNQESDNKTRIEVELQNIVTENEESDFSHEENKHRWLFISKVYGVLAAQVAFCAAVSAAVNFSPLIKAFICGIHPVVAFCSGLSPFMLIWPMITYRKRVPLNVIMLGLFTMCTSVASGLGCALLSSNKVVIQAILTAAAVVLAITGYAIWGSISGQDFSYPRPFLFSCGAILVLSIVQVFFPLVSASGTLFAGVVAIIFAGFLVYDRDELIKRYGPKQYIEASICVYSDIIHLFHCTFHVLRLIVQFHLWFFGFTQ